MMKREIVHCVKYPKYRFTLCGLENATSLDLFSGSWQNWISKFSEKLACPNCEMRWRKEVLPAELVGMTLTISDEALVKIKELEIENELAKNELIKNPIIFD